MQLDFVSSSQQVVSTVYDGAHNVLQQLDSFDANLILLKHKLDSFETQTWFFRCKLEFSETQTWFFRCKLEFSETQTWFFRCKLEFSETEAWLFRCKLEFSETQTWFFRCKLDFSETQTWILRKANLILFMQTWIPQNANLNLSRKWNSRIEENLYLPLESYSPWSPWIINYGLKSRNEMRYYSIYILYSLSSKDLQRTLRKSCIKIGPNAVK